MSSGRIVIALGNAPSYGETFSGETVTLEERVWLTEDKKEAVPDGDRKARFLLGNPGDELAIELARRYGLVVDDDEDESKQRTPQQSKPRTPARNK